jgi:hypothetical protein
MIDSLVNEQLPQLSNANYRQLYPTYNSYFAAMIEHNKLRMELKQKLIAEQTAIEGVDYE